MNKEKLDPLEEDAFNIEKQFNLFLKVCKMDKRKMPSIQITSMRRAFYGAWGMLLLVNRDCVAVLTDDQAVEALDKMFRDTELFWAKEIVPISNMN